MNAIKTKTVEEFSKYERARILGARALQISMDAPILAKINKEELDNLNFDPLRIAEIEVDSGVLPITVKRPMPQRKEENLDKIKVEQPRESDKDKVKTENEEEKDIQEKGEIMALVQDDDEGELEETGGAGGVVNGE